MSRQSMNLRRAARIARQYKLLIGGVALVGLIGGAAYEALFPAKLSSTALVVISPAPQSIATDVLMANSQPVFSDALHTLGRPGMTIESLSGSVRASALTLNAISITAQASTGAEAEAEANAVASSYVRYIGSSVTSPIGAVNAKVAVPATSASGRGVAKDLAIDGLIGGVTGLMVGFTLALRAQRGDRRLRSRDEIAVAVGVPVIAAVPSEMSAEADPGDWLTFFDEYQPSAVHAWRLRSALGRLGATPESSANGQGRLSVTVLSQSTDEKAVALGPQLASYAASLGIPTAFIVSTPRDTGGTAALRAACGTSVASLRGGKLLLAVDTGSGVGSGLSYAKLIVVTTVVDEDTSQLPGGARTITALLGLSAGAVTGEQLARSAALAADAGSLIIGTIVADPDDDDKTTGLTPRPAPIARHGLPTKHANVKEVRSGDRTRPANSAAHGRR